MYFDAERHLRFPKLGTDPYRLATRWLLTPFLAASILGTGCARTGDTGDASPTTPSTATTTPVLATTTTATPASTVPPDAASSPLLTTMAPLVIDRSMWLPVNIEAFEGYVRAEQAAVRAEMAPVTPDHPDLAATHTGTALQNRHDGIRRSLLNDQAVRPPTVFEIRPFRLKGANETKLMFYSCYISNEALYQTSTGRVIDDQQFEQPLEVGMQRVDGVWKLAVSGEPDKWKGKSCEDAFASLR
jgi:hypothetical protein